MKCSGLKNFHIFLGGTTLAASVTLITFFIGIASGQFYFEKLVNRFRSNSKTLSILLLLLTVSGSIILLPNTVLLGVFSFTHYQPHFQVFLKFIIALVIMFPVSFLSGLLFPWLCLHNRLQHVSISLLYGVYSFGGAAGIFTTTFILFAALGFSYSLFFIIALNILLCIATNFTPIEVNEKTTTDPSLQHQYSQQVVMFSLLSGFCTFALEMLFLRMFSYVDHNSTYTFALVLTFILLAFAAGAILANLLLKKFKPDNLLYIQILLTAISLLFIPSIFIQLTDGLYPLEGNPSAGWIGYLLELIKVGAFTIFFPLLFAGTIFPTLLHSNHTKKSTGSSSKKKNHFSMILLLNTIGIIGGYIVSTYILPSTAGLWKSIYSIAIVYTLSLFFLRISKKFIITSLLLLIVETIVLTVSNAPAFRTDLKFSQNDICLVDFKENSSGSLAIIQSPDNLRILLNNKYFLGGTRALDLQQNQSNLPLIVHGNPQNVFFIGMGTGITAGSALNFPVKQITVSEINREVIPLAKKWFTPYTNGLFTNEKVTILPEDGQWLLRNSPIKYDVIICDLILPWESGAGRLYSKECFNTVFNRLEDNGLYALCLPLYQLTKEDFLIICKTFTSTFPLVTMWRNNYVPNAPSVILTGFKQSTKLSPTKSDILLSDTIIQKSIKLIPYSNFKSNAILALYCGNLTQFSQELASTPINTEDNMLIENLSPIEQYNSIATKGTNWFTGEAFVDFLVTLQRNYPPTKDPFLADIDSNSLTNIEEGFKMFIYGN